LVDWLLLLTLSAAFGACVGWLQGSEGKSSDELQSSGVVSRDVLAQFLDSTAAQMLRPGA
jgi:hypothetical protein